ncbi:MAG: hypothetical protein EZS28_005522 [Streblomastix strix]|uniref:Uncharacterized protein n=1 Tax=Streblomastix strix TaxID=222440 RepID=A0A5J4WVD6_9EUKA|nr:MAG: hypothetical protein EZS28_005522 [Streblomastix strix]
MWNIEKLIYHNYNIRKVVFNTPNALHSLCTLASYKLNIHFSQKNDQQTLEVRYNCRGCLFYIQDCGDASAQTELVNARYARVLVIAISTASGSGEEQDDEIKDGLSYISIFLNQLHKGINSPHASFPPQPLLAHRSDEQIEGEGGNEEIDSQLINKGHQYCDIKGQANRAQGRILNHFIKWGNPKPDCHPIDSTAWEMEQGITSQLIQFTYSINRFNVYFLCLIYSFSGCFVYLHYILI